jgi:hypothetical protein
MKCYGSRLLIKIPLHPPFPKGEYVPLFGKEGFRGDFMDMKKHLMPILLTGGSCG